jgi:hypothetical protein
VAVALLGSLAELVLRSVACIIQSSCECTSMGCKPAAAEPAGVLWHGIGSKWACKASEHEARSFAVFGDRATKDPCSTGT